MLTTMYKMDHKKKLRLYGNMTAREVYENKREGWKLESRDVTNEKK